MNASTQTQQRHVLPKCPGVFPYCLALLLPPVRPTQRSTMPLPSSTPCLPAFLSGLQNFLPLVLFYVTEVESRGTKRKQREEKGETEVPVLLRSQPLNKNREGEGKCSEEEMPCSLSCYTGREGRGRWWWWQAEI